MSRGGGGAGSLLQIPPWSFGFSKSHSRNILDSKAALRRILTRILVLNEGYTDWSVEWTCYVGPWSGRLQTCIFWVRSFILLNWIRVKIETGFVPELPTIWRRNLSRRRFGSEKSHSRISRTLFTSPFTRRLFTLPTSRLLPPGSSICTLKHVIYKLIWIIPPKYRYRQFS